MPLCAPRAHGGPSGKNRSIGRSRTKASHGWLRFGAPGRSEDRKATGMPFADTTLWIPLVAALGAATGAVILSALVFALLSRSREARGRKLAGWLEESSALFEER